MARWMVLAAIACASVANSCSIDHRSDAYACAQPSDCETGRACVEGLCVLMPDAPPPPPPQCRDGRDNDGDGLIDGADPGCTGASDNSERGTAACDDGADNDADGRIDFLTNAALTDPGCSGPGDTSERGTLACDDGIDNDCDGRSDFSTNAALRDPGCESVLDTSERGMAQCDDGIDNDGDGRVDFKAFAGCGAGDAQCTSPFDNIEAF